MTAGAILLAGGVSTRFESDKRFSRLRNGRKLLDTSIENILKSGLPLLVCLRDTDSELEATLTSRGISCLRCPDSKLGIGHTLASGIYSVRESWHAVLIALADMPLIQPRSFCSVRDAIEPGKNRRAIL